MHNRYGFTWTRQEDPVTPILNINQKPRMSYVGLLFDLLARIYPAPLLSASIEVYPVDAQLQIRRVSQYQRGLCSA